MSTQVLKKKISLQLISSINMCFFSKKNGEIDPLVSNFLLDQNNQRIVYETNMNKKFEDFKKEIYSYVNEFIPQDNHKKDAEHTDAENEDEDDKRKNEEVEDDKKDKKSKKDKKDKKSQRQEFVVREEHDYNREKDTANGVENDNNANTAYVTDKLSLIRKCHKEHEQLKKRMDEMQTSWDSRINEIEKKVGDISEKFEQLRSVTEGIGIPVNSPQRDDTLDHSRILQTPTKLFEEASLAIEEPSVKKDIFEYIRDGNLNGVRWLIKQDKEYNLLARTDTNRTPLMFAAFRGYLPICRYLVEKGANVNDQDDDGYTPLLMAARYNRTDICIFLLNSGANPSASNSHGNTALIWAAWDNAIDVLKCLIQKGAEKNHKNKEGKTALSYAVSCNCEEAVSYLRSVGCKE